MAKDMSMTPLTHTHKHTPPGILATSHHASHHASHVIQPRQLAHDGQELVLFSLALLFAIHKDHRVPDLQNQHESQYPIQYERHANKRRQTHGGGGAVKWVEVKKKAHLKTTLC